MASALARSRVPAVGLPHDVEDLQRALLVGGGHRLAAGP